MINLEENERIDDLEINGLKIVQNEKWFCFGVDAVLLSDFAKKMKKGAKLLDLGTGTAILPILLSAKTDYEKAVGVEVQEELCKMARKSVILNGLENRIEILCKNIKELNENFEKNTFDVVVTNPPYKKERSGIINENIQKVISRHEIEANLEDFIKISFDLLKDKGDFYMVHHPERLTDILFYMRKYKIEPKNLKFVFSRQNKIPKLVLIKGVKNAKPFLEIEKPLIIYNNDNTYTDEILEIYNKK